MTIQGWSQYVQGTISQHVRSYEDTEWTLQPVLQGDMKTQMLLRNKTKNKN